MLNVRGMHDGVQHQPGCVDATAIERLMDTLGIPSSFQRTRWSWVVLRGGRSFGMSRRWQPVPRMYISPFITSRMFTLRLLPHGHLHFQGDRNANDICNRIVGI